MFYTLLAIVVALEKATMFADRAQLNARRRHARAGRCRPLTWMGRGTSARTA